MSKEDTKSELSIQFFGKNHDTTIDKEVTEQNETNSIVENDSIKKPKQELPEVKNEFVIEEGIENFGRVVVPKDVSDEQIGRIINKTIKAENESYQLVELGPKQSIKDTSSITRSFAFIDANGYSGFGFINFIFDEKPVIYAKEFVIDGGSELEKINWREKVKAFDKEDGDISKLVRWDYQAVNVTKDGIYPITYSVTNSHGETSQLVVWMRVKILAPVLTADDITMTASLSPNKRLLIAQVAAKDVLDGNLINQLVVDDSQVSYEVVGIYPIIYRVKNTFGLETIVEKQITIEAQEPELVVSPLKLKATKDASEVDWLAHARAVDPIDGDITNQIAVDNHQIDLQRGGMYPISYKVSNRNGKTVTANSSVIVSVPQPQITATTFEIERGSDLNQIDWLSHVTAVDEDGTDLTQYITTFYEEINPNETGEYNLYYMVRNNYKQQTTKRVTVSVK